MIRILGIFIICSMALSSSINDKVHNKIQKIKSDENPTSEVNLGVGYNF